MKTKQFILTLLLSFTFLSCDDDSSLTDVTMDLPDGVASCAEHDNTSQYAANRSFAFDIFNAMNEEDSDKNIFISPFSISVALQMLYNGASGAGQAQMEETLHLSGMELDEINQNYFCLLDELAKLDEQVVLNIANSMWSRNDFTANEDFLRRNEDFLGSSYFSEDFSDPATLEKINDWIADKTEDKIIDMLDEIPSNAIMYLINAIYFKGDWKFAFDPEFSVAGSFFGLDDVAISTTYMKQTAEYNYTRTDKFQAIDLPYGEDKFAFSIFLPTEDINDFIEDFTVEEYRAAIDQYQLTEVSVELPKFDLEYKKLLNDLLKKLGISAVFSSGSLQNINEDYDLSVSRVIHQTFLEVNEEGTEAAAATIVEIIESAANLPETMRMNRPFCFLIRDTVNDNILFTGKVVNPES